MNCKEPRIPYKRTYVYFHPSVDENKALDIFRANFDDKRTFGFSADDAGLGVNCLPERNIVAYGVPAAEQLTYLTFWEEHYPGAAIQFVNLSQEGDLWIDISYWQRFIKLDEAKADGVEHVIIKATEWTVPDPASLSLVGKTIDVGLPYSLYHFYTNNSNPYDQADAFINLALQAAMVFGVGHERLYLDLEQTNDLNEQTVENIQVFLNIVTDTLTKPGIYTGKWWVNSHLLPAVNHDKSKIAFMGNYDLWLAHYSNTPPQPFYPWSDVHLWQMGQFLNVWNVNACDVNTVMRV